MDSAMKTFLASGMTLIQDTMEVKSKPVKVPKLIEKVEVVGSWDKVLISRCVDEKTTKAEVIEAFKKIIAQEESLI